MEKAFEIIKESISVPEAANELMSQMFTVTRPEAVFAQPLTQGEYTAINASEVSVGLGFGYGSGGGLAPEEEHEGTEAGQQAGGYGSGGGGGGGAMARPVAVIEIGPHGVRVEPIVDPTKIVLAFFTAFGAMFMMLARMRKLASD
ncbi:MAG: spore germination protein GerW family protein [Chloroflexota bacterium]